MISMAPRSRRVQTVRRPVSLSRYSVAASITAETSAVFRGRDLHTYGFYTVAKGDNLYALARDFFTTMAELQRINNLGSSTTIFPGNDLIVPTSKYNAYHQKGEVANR